MQGHFDPAVLADRIRIRHLEGLDRTRQEVKRVADDFPQQLLRRFQGTFGGDDRGGGRVMGGARLLHVGDRDEPDLIARLSLV